MYNNKNLSSPHSSKFTSAQKGPGSRPDTGRGVSVSARKPEPVAIIEMSQKQRNFMTPKVSRSNLKSDRVQETPKEPLKDESLQKISVDLKRSHSKQQLQNKQPTQESQSKKKPSGRSQSRDRERERVVVSPKARAMSPKAVPSYEPKYSQQVVSPKQAQDNKMIREMRNKNKEILNEINNLDQEIQK